EIGIATCFAAYWNVPLILMQGPETACRETEAQSPGAVTAAVKGAESHDRCSGLDAESARRLTAQKVAEAIEKLRSDPPPPYKPSLPMRVTVRLTSPTAPQSPPATPT